MIMVIIVIVIVIVVVIVIVGVIVGDDLCHPLNGLKVSWPHVLARVHSESTHSNVYLIIYHHNADKLRMIMMKSWR